MNGNASNASATGPGSFTANGNGSTAYLSYFGNRTLAAPVPIEVSGEARRAPWTLTSGLIVFIAAYLMLVSIQHARWQRVLKITLDLIMRKTSLSNDDDEEFLVAMETAKNAPTAEADEPINSKECKEPLPLLSQLDRARTYAVDNRAATTAQPPNVVDPLVLPLYRGDVIA